MKQTQESNKKSSLLRIDLDLHTSIGDELAALKKRKKGRGKIRASDILRLLLPRLTEEDRLQLLTSTYTSEDRQKVAFRNYSRKHKNASEDTFKTLVQFGEINFSDYLPDEMKKSILTPKRPQMEV